MTVRVQAIAPVAGQPFGGIVARFTTDQNLTGNLANFSATIFAGDDNYGTPGTITVDSGGGFDVFGQFTYSRPGTKTINVLVQSSDMSKESASRAITVADARLALVPSPLNVDAGSAFTASVATFTSASPTASASNFEATIDWGDKTPSTPGLVSTGSQGGFVVIGNHNYATPGNYPTTITVRDRLGIAPFIATSAALVAGSPVLAVTPRLIVAYAGQPIPPSMIVASFTDGMPARPTTDFQAEIDWGNGDSTVGSITGPDSSGKYQIVGTYTYPSVGNQGSFPVSVTVADAAGRKTSVTTSAIVVNSGPAYQFTGTLAPGSDTGPRHSGTLTNTATPTFVGSTRPFDLVQLTARKTGFDATFPLGQVIASPSGQWLMTVGPLADGDYVIQATVTPAGGSPGPALLANNGRLIVDSTPPQVLSVVPLGDGHRVVVTFHDSLGGLDTGSLLNPSSYVFYDARNVALTGPIKVKPQNPGLLASDAYSVVVTMPTNPKHHGHPTQLRILNGGITDLAGNRLLGPARGLFAPIAGHSRFKPLKSS